MGVFQCVAGQSKGGDALFGVARGEKRGVSEEKEEAEERSESGRKGDGVFQASVMFQWLVPVAIRPWHTWVDAGGVV